MNCLKLLLFTALFFWAGTAIGQTRLKLVLRSSQKVDSASVTHWTNKESVSLAFRDTLRLKFNTAGPDFYDINFISDGMIYNTPVFLDTGDVEVFATMLKGRVNVDSVAGSPYYNRIKKWQDDFTAIRAKKNSDIIDSFLVAGYREFADDLYSFRIGSIYINLHKSNPSKLYPLLPLVAMQDSNIKKKFGFSLFHDRLQKLINNRSVDLSLFNFIDTGNNIVFGPKGITIINFWSADCAPCVADHQRIPAFLPELKKRGVDVVSISTDDSYSKWKDHLDKNNYGWRQYKEIPENKLADQIGITAVPVYILLDAAGKMVYTSSSLDEIVKQAAFHH